MAFWKKHVALGESASGRMSDFAYLDTGEVYMDSACQSLRPQPVIDALNEYYTNFNACGGRVKYAWGQKVDELVSETRGEVLKLLKLPSKDYVVSFTLNTTYGLNLILQQIPSGKFGRVVTSEIEHNSVFLPTITLAERLKIPRKVLSRSDDGSLQYSEEDLDGATVVLNAMSNIDGRLLKNVRRVVDDTHKSGGIVILDAAQAMANSHEILQNCGADAICFSAHKMYGASLGVVVIRRDLLKILHKTFVGGGMVHSVSEQMFELLPDDMSSWLEPGLQAWGEIIALNRAMKWLHGVKPNGQDRHEYITELSQKLFDGLSQIPNIKMINHEASPVVSLYSKKYDAHQLAIFLSAAGIMARSGYFCCHYYLQEKKKFPPLLRFSIGLHNTPEDIEKTIRTMQKIIGGK